MRGLLGQGAVGRVLQVFDRDLGRQVALKTMRPEIASNDEARRRFLLEARTAAALEHSNILPIYDLCRSSDGSPCFSMRHLDGCSLGDAIRKAERGEVPAGIRTVNDRINCMLRVCDAIGYAHSKGIVHQDIKPDNILISTYGEVMLVDWGASTGSQEGTLIGTPLYMSPEQAKCEATDQRSDVYALGCTLFHLLTLRLPTMAPGVSEFWAKKQAGVIDPLTATERLAVPLPLQAIVSKALAPRPDARYQSAGDLAEDLRHFQAGLAVSAYSEDFRDVVRRMVRVYRRGLITAAIAAVVLIVLGAMVTHLVRAEREQRNAAYRSQVAEEAKRKEAERREAALEAQRREGWIPIVELDFANTAELPPDLVSEFCPADQLMTADRNLRSEPAVAEIRDGVLALRGIVRGQMGLGTIRMGTQANEDVRVQAVVRESGSIGLSLGGSSFTGYRAIFDFSRGAVAIDSIEGGIHRVYTSGRFTPRTAKTSQLMAEKVGSLLRVELDGQEILRYVDPLPKSGTDHRAIGVNVFCSEVAITSIRAERRQPPEVVPVLEIARALVRGGAFTQAADFCADLEATRAGTPMAIEALLLRGIVARLHGDHDAALALLAPLAFGNQSDQRTVVRAALWESAQVHLQRNAFREAAAVAQRARDFDGSADLAQNVMWAARNHLIANIAAPTQIGNRQQRLPPEQVEQLLRGLARLDVDELSLSDCRLESIRGLDGVRASSIILLGNTVSDLGPLRGARLVRLDANGNAVRDLEPLRGMQLRDLSLEGAPVTDLSPLHGMPLVSVNLSKTGVVTLAPLAGAPLNGLNISRCGVTDIAPLSGMPLEYLWATGCPIRDLRPLSAAKLRGIGLDDTLVDDLGPLRGMPLSGIDIARTGVVSLAPLAGMALDWLNVGDTAVEDLTPLAGMPLHRLLLARARPRSLAPLADCPIASLDIRGVGLSEADRAVVAGLPLTEIAIDFAAETPALLERCARLTVVNGRDATWVRGLATDLAVAATGRPANLARYATDQGSCRRLLVPIAMPRALAKEWAEREGAELAYPLPGEALGALVVGLPAFDSTTIDDRAFGFLHITLEFSGGAWGWKHGAGTLPTQWTSEGSDEPLALGLLHQPSALLANGAAAREACPLLQWAR
ncbi:MAG: protein kinase [Planctomycetes bacterium]|nr:protein kinase [Planctomycetota bacterium]